MGSKSKSSSSTTTNTKTANLALEDVDGVTVAGDRNAVTVTDGGAFKVVENMGADVIEAAGDLGSGAFDLAADVVDYLGTVNQRSVDAVMQTATKAQESETAAMASKLVLVAGIGAAAMVGMKAVGK